MHFLVPSAFATALFHILSCKYSLLILNLLVRTMVTYVELEGQPHKLAGASHTGHNSWFSFLFQGLPLFMLTPPKDCMQGAGAEFLLCSDSAACIGTQRLLGRWWWPAEISLFGPTWQDNVEAAQIHSRLILRDHLGSGAGQNAFNLRLIHNAT